jgi:hypothetical protein
MSMKKLLFLFSFLAIASLMANAQLQYHFEDTSHTDFYCDGVSLNLFSFGGAPLTYVDGYHDFTSVCGFGFNTPQVGFKATIPLLNGDWIHGTSAVTSDLTDQVFGQLCSLVLANNLKPFGDNGRWEFYSDCNANGGGWFVTNFGFAGHGLPGTSSPVQPGPQHVAAR